MLTRIKRTKADQLTVTFKLPVPAPFRRHFDSAVRAVRRSVIPVLSEWKPHEPRIVGSATLLELGPTKFLVTAEHVMDESERAPVFYFNREGLPRQLGDEFIVDEEGDIAAKRLDPDEADMLSHRPFLRERICAAKTGFRAASMRVWLATLRRL